MVFKSKIASLICLVLTICFINCVSIFAADEATIDDSKVSDGIVKVTYKGADKSSMKIMVQKGSDKYVYDITGDVTNCPLQMGSGAYKVIVLKSAGGSKYQGLANKDVNAPKINELAMYTYSIPIINFNESMKAIKAYKEMAGSKQGQEKVDLIYNDVVDNYSYDFDKAKSVKSNYVPVIDSIYASKKGICYDYSSLVASSLRSQGIPTKLIMGYAPNIKEYHAWNEIYVGGKWVVVDTTYDAQAKNAKIKFDFAKDAKLFKTLKSY